MARYLNIEMEVIPFYLKVRAEVPMILRSARLMSSYYRVGSESLRQVERLADVLNAIERNMQHFDECCDGTLYEETQLIIRLCGAIERGYAGDVDRNGGGGTYAGRVDASIERIRQAVSDVRTLANLRLCSECNLLRSECECERCEYCEERIADCECATCMYCDRNVNACSCEHCYYCGENMHDCYCERCNTCEERLSDCTCERCERCHKLSAYCICPPDAVTIIVEPELTR